MAYDCPLRFQGQWADRENGLYYNRHRYYDSSISQYISPDPIGLKGGALPQAYTTNPITTKDIFGLSSSVVRDIDPYSLTPTHSIEGARSSTLVRDMTKRMQENGFGSEPIDVIVIRGKRYVVDGHHRLAAAKRAGVNVDANIKNPSDVFSPGGYRDEKDVIDSGASAGPNRLRP